MTREEAREAIKEAYGNPEYPDEIIKALEKEPKSEWEHDHEILKAYSDGANEMLDNIRAEIEAKCCITVGRENDGAITLHDVFEIIDKYKE